jgi:lecithin:retinol acyltransferase
VLYFREPLAVISCPRGGVFRHVGILLPDGRVAHCAPSRGEHISTVEEFAAGQDVTIERLLTPEQCASSLRRIAEAMCAPKAYDGLTNNCEMFVNRMIGQRSESPQLQGAALLIGLAALARWAAR